MKLLELPIELQHAVDQGDLGIMAALAVFEAAEDEQQRCAERIAGGRESERGARPGAGRVSHVGHGWFLRPTGGLAKLLKPWRADWTRSTSAATTTW